MEWEKTYEVRHEGTGAPVGIATLRDTIIIAKISDGYEVKNWKWKKNEFDEEGWVKQEHDASPSYTAKFEESTQTLNSRTPNLLDYSHLSKSGQKKNTFSRVRQGRNTQDYSIDNVIQFL